jgi:hypothetical protein
MPPLLTRWGIAAAGGGDNDELDDDGIHEKG